MLSKNIHGFLCRCYLSPDDVVRNHPHLLIIGAGFAFGFLVVRFTYCCNVLG